MIFPCNQQHQVNRSVSTIYRQSQVINRDILEPKLFCSTRAGVATSIETCTRSNIVKLLNTYCVYVEKKKPNICAPVRLWVWNTFFYHKSPARLDCAENHRVINCSGFSSSFTIILLVSTTSGWDGSPSKYSGFSNGGKATTGIRDFLWRKYPMANSVETPAKTRTITRLVRARLWRLLFPGGPENPVNTLN